MTKILPKTIPFSIRFTPAEKAELEHRAGSAPLGVYARERLLGRAERNYRRLRTKQTKAPTVDRTALAQVLGLLGKSERERNLKYISEAARVGALLLTPDVLEHIDQACRDIAEIKSMVMKALGIKED